MKKLNLMERMKALGLKAPAPGTSILKALDVELSREEENLRKRRDAIVEYQAAESEEAADLPALEVAAAEAAEVLRGKKRELEAAEIAESHARDAFRGRRAALEDRKARARKFLLDTADHRIVKVIQELRSRLLGADPFLHDAAADPLVRRAEVERAIAAAEEIASQIEPPENIDELMASWEKAGKRDSDPGHPDLLGVEVEVGGRTVRRKRDSRDPLAGMASTPTGASVIKSLAHRESERLKGANQAEDARRRAGR